MNDSGVRLMEDMLKECQRIIEQDRMQLEVERRRQSRVPHFSVQLVRDGAAKIPQRTVNHPSVVVEYFLSMVGDPPQEHLWVVLLDKNNRIIGDSEISVGTFDHTVAEAADVMRLVINSPAASFVIIHNHPSGSCDPSPSDKISHQNILDASRIFRRPMMDAIIVGNNTGKYYSAASSYDLR